MIRAGFHHLMVIAFFYSSQLFSASAILPGAAISPISSDIKRISISECLEDIVRFIRSLDKSILLRKDISDYILMLSLESITSSAVYEALGDIKKWFEKIDGKIAIETLTSSESLNDEVLLYLITISRFLSNIESRIIACFRDEELQRYFLMMCKQVVRKFSIKYTGISRISDLVSRLKIDFGEQLKMPENRVSRCGHAIMLSSQLSVTIIIFSGFLFAVILSTMINDKSSEIKIPGLIILSSLIVVSTIYYFATKKMNDNIELVDKKETLLKSIVRALEIEDEK